MSEKVILISIDGMRPDGLTACGHPFVQELCAAGSYSLQASSVFPSVTLPCHTSMFYGVPPQRHGIVTNDYTPPVRPILGIAEQAARAEKTCAAFYNWEPMRHVWHSENMKYTTFVEAYEEENSDLFLTDAALELIRRKEPDFVYLYLVETDEKGGHDHGWMTDEYMAQLHNAVSCAEKVYRQAGDRYHILITADHGGHGRGHGDDCPEDMTIPMFFLGKAFEPGLQLTNISLLNLAPTVAQLLGIPSSREWEGQAVPMNHSN